VCCELCGSTVELARSGDRATVCVVNCVVLLSNWHGLETATVCCELRGTTVELERSGDRATVCVVNCVVLLSNWHGPETEQRCVL